MRRQEGELGGEVVGDRWEDTGWRDDRVEGHREPIVTEGSLERFKLSKE